MAWKLVLKIDSNKDITEEHVIATGYGSQYALNTLFYAESEGTLRCCLKPKQQKDILKNTKDASIVVFILGWTEVDLSENELKDLVERKFSNNTGVKSAILSYCKRKKKRLYKKFSQYFV